MVVSCTSACHPHTKAGWKQMSYCCGIFAIFGVALLITSAVLPKVLDDALYSELDDATIISGPNVPGYEKWANNQDDPILLSTYIIDILNPTEILNGSTPIIAERGPYVYREYKVNYNVTWSNDGDIMTYHQYKYYVFQPDLSVEDDTAVNYTTINMAVQGITSGAAHSPNIYAKGFVSIVYNEKNVNITEEEKLFSKKTPREIMFGWSDPGLAFLKTAGLSDTDRYPGSVLNMTSMEHANTLNKTYVQYTGYTNVDRIREYVEFEHMNSIVTCYDALCPPAIKLPAWGSEHANAVRGTDGSQWKRDITPTDTLQFFYAPTFRAVNLVHKGETSYRDVPLYKYHLPETMWQNSTINPANADYHQYGPSGMLNLTILSFNSSVFVTYPRMEGVDETIRSQVIYQSTVNVTAPETVFFVEPISGAVFFAETSSQGVLYIEPIPWIQIPDSNNVTTWFRNLKPVYIPLFWASETGGISEPDAKKFNDGISLIKTTKTLSNYAGIPIGILCVLIGIYCTWRSRQHHYRHPGTKKVLSDTHTLLDTDQAHSDKLAAIKIDDLPTTNTTNNVTSPYGTFKPGTNGNTSPTNVHSEPTTPESPSMNHHNGVTLYQSP